MLSYKDDQDESRIIQTAIGLPRDLVNRLKSEAATLHISLSAYCRRVFRHHLDAHACKGCGSRQRDRR
jgi:hypothetical protein